MSPASHGNQRALPPLGAAIGVFLVAAGDVQNGDFRAAGGVGSWAVRLAVMAGGFDASRAMGAGLGDRRRVREFIAEFATAWTRPLAPGDGYGDDVLWAAGHRLGVRLPTALRDAYLLFGKRADLTACQDPLLPPEAP